MLALAEDPHRRFNPLTREWVLVSPHRTRRPWQGKIEEVSELVRKTYDPDCYLCPGNTRAGGARNPDYTSTLVFDNDYSALLPDTSEDTNSHNELLIARGERGLCRVICFSPRHDLSLPTMSREQIRAVVDLWAEQYRELGGRPWINSVLIFENRGIQMGASNPHPHCQVWANANMPNQPFREGESQQAYRERRGSCLLCDYLQIEVRSAQRMVCQNESFIAVVPFWAIWPFETLVLSKRHLAGLDQLAAAERDSLAEILRILTIRYDNLFETAFPYSMGFHQRPTDNEDHPEWHFHAHFYPPLLRSGAISKFLVGYEMLGSPQRDITPEDAADRLRALSDRHYLKRQ